MRSKILKISIFHHCLSFLGILFITQCNNTEVTERTRGAKKNVVAKKNVADSCLNVVGGKATAKYPGVSLILSKTQSNKLGQCTGTFVSPNVVFTATHCLKSATGKELNIYGPDGRSHKVARAFHYGVIGAELDPSAIKEKPYLDFVILELEDSVDVETIAMLSSSPEVGDNLEIVGYGGEWGRRNRPVKRIGENSVASMESDGAIVYTVKDRQGNDKGEYSEKGDSGGPLLVDGQLAGIISVGSNEVVLAVDLNGPKSRELIEKARDSGLDIPDAGANSANDLFTRNNINKSKDDQALQGNEICISMR